MSARGQYLTKDCDSLDLFVGLGPDARVEAAGLYARALPPCACREISMATYTFFRIKDDGLNPSFEIADFDRDEWALSYGKSILARASRYTAVELVKGEEQIAVLTRNGMMLREHRTAADRKVSLGSNTGMAAAP